MALHDLATFSYIVLAFVLDYLFFIKGVAFEDDCARLEWLGWLFWIAISLIITTVELDNVLLGAIGFVGMIIGVIKILEVSSDWRS